AGEEGPRPTNLRGGGIPRPRSAPRVDGSLVAAGANVEIDAHEGPPCVSVDWKRRDIATECAHADGVGRIGRDGGQDYHFSRLYGSRGRRDVDALAALA